MRHPLAGALLVLTFTGVIDAASYLGRGHVFTANMTGNVVLLVIFIPAAATAERAGEAGIPHV